MPRAKYIFHEGGERLLAVYGDGVKPADLALTVLQLKRLPGVFARATRVALNSP